MKHPRPTAEEVAVARANTDRIAVCLVLHAEIDALRAELERLTKVARAAEALVDTEDYSHDAEEVVAAFAVLRGALGRQAPKPSAPRPPAPFVAALRRDSNSALVSVCVGDVEVAEVAVNDRPWAEALSVRLSAAVEAEVGRRAREALAAHEARVVAWLQRRPVPEPNEDAERAARAGGDDGER